MMHSRREFLVGGASIAATAVLPAVPVAWAEELQEPFVERRPLWRIWPTDTPPQRAGVNARYVFEWVSEEKGIPEADVDPEDVFAYVQYWGFDFDKVLRARKYILAMRELEAEALRAQDEPVWCGWWSDAEWDAWEHEWRERAKLIAA